MTITGLSYENNPTFLFSFSRGNVAKRLKIVDHNFVNLVRFCADLG